ncbi:putative rhamnosyl transferase [Planktotalea sp.]|uniref:putative rhamnosyl transferase n=1 Tax=Planktotalea sp. TaxID=2029877 RepID=UPI003D6BA76C
MQVIGLCRFSFPALGGFQVEHESAQERSAYLYRTQRMDERFRHFETIMLPSIAAQTDPDFTFVIVIGDNLPEHYQERLFDLCAPIRQIIIQAHAPADHRETMQKAMNSVRNKTDAPCLQFRHDDDDAIAVNFVETYRNAAIDCRPLLERNKFVGFDFARGFIVRPCAEGIYANETFHPYWGVALGISIAPHIRKSIMNFAHGKINRFMPTLSFDNPPMYLRGHNDFNDSRQGPKVSKPKMMLLDAAGEQSFRDLFAVDADQVRRVFG